MRQRTTMFTMQTVARYCRLAGRKAGRKAALIMLEGDRASKAGGEGKMNSDCKTPVQHSHLIEENHRPECPD